MGRFPLLLLSHGNTGTPLALHDLATSLARQGFVVVAVVHPGDNDRDHSRLGSLSNLYGRPLQISEAISTALLDPLLAPYLNARQVGVIGYSAGGETALILAGAQPDLQRLRQYCVERPTDRDACKTQGELVADRDDLHAQADPRVGALMLMAPLSLMFGRHTLGDVHVPVLMYAGTMISCWPSTETQKHWRASCRSRPTTSYWPGQGISYSWHRAVMNNARVRRCCVTTLTESTVRIFTAI